MFDHQWTCAILPHGTDVGCAATPSHRESVKSSSKIRWKLGPARPGASGVWRDGKFIGPLVRLMSEGGEFARDAGPPRGRAGCTRLGCLLVGSAAARDGLVGRIHM